MAMTPLRRRMIEDMSRFAGWQPTTGGRRNELSEEEVRSYLIRLRERGAARGTFEADHYGIRFLCGGRSHG